MKGQKYLTPASETAIRSHLTLDLRDVDRLASVAEHSLQRGVLFVPTTQMPAVGALVDVWLLLPSPHGRLAARGSVVRTRPSIPGVELQIAESALLHARLIDLLQALRSS
jgi:hypothetical protein